MRNPLPFLVLLGALLPSCTANDEEPLVCGAGTLEQNGECVPDNCGPGTVMEGDECIPDNCGSGTVMEDGFCIPDNCGPGTIMEDGECIPDNCGPGTVMVGDECLPDNCADGTAMVGFECVPLDFQYVQIPLSEGATAHFGQTFHGYFSHNGASRYAVDLSMPEGTTVTAARGGRVLSIKEDSDSGCGEVSCASDGNFVNIDHGDGTKAIYYHLQQDGALVDVGDIVCAGEPIGLSGNTGFSTGPHLHFSISNATGQTLPLRFNELADLSEGVPAPGMVVESANADPGDCDDDVEWSECPSDLFAHLGVFVDPGIPCSVAATDTAYPISGWATSGETVVVGYWGQDPIEGTGTWLYQCDYIGLDGSWSQDLTFVEEALFDGTWMIIFSGDSECYQMGGGWNASVWLELDIP